jgi:hypothetical protein
MTSAIRSSGQFGDCNSTSVWRLWDKYNLEEQQTYED